MYQPVASHSVASLPSPAVSVANDGMLMMVHPHAVDGFEYSVLETRSVALQLHKDLSIPMS